MPLSGSSLELNQNPEKLVFLLHGYGDNAQNFISIANDLYDPNFNLNFYAPNAPSSVPQYPLGRQWFDLYPNGINFNEAGPKEKEIMREDCLSSIKLLKEYINSYCLKFNLSFEDCFIFGFSQGAMMTFEIGKYIDKIFAGCAMISGRILPSDDHTKKIFVKTPIIVIHGDKDSILPPNYFTEACKILKTQGYTYESYLLKDEEHIISQQTIDLVKKFIKKNL